MSFISRLRRLILPAEFWGRLSAGLGRRRQHAPAPRATRLRLAVEALERRELLSGTVIAVNQNASTPVNTMVAISVLAGDASSDGSPLTLSSFGGAAHGTTTLDPNYTNFVDYTPAAGFIGNDSSPTTQSIAPVPAPPAPSSSPSATVPAAPPTAGRSP